MSAICTGVTTQTAATAGKLPSPPLPAPQKPTNKQVVLYGGKGAHPHCVQATKAALSHFLNEQIVVGDEKYFQNEEWIAKTKLVVIPGGDSTSDIMFALHENGLGNIQKALFQEKVAYLGICAGAFLASRLRTFKNDPFGWPFNGKVPIAFEGEACGPVTPHPLFKASSDKVRTVWLHGNGMEMKPLYYENGPSFKGAESMHNVKVLADFVLSLNDLVPAIIHCTDKVNAVLCGAHPEFPEIGKTSVEPEDAHLDPNFSKTAFKVMLQALGLLSAITPQPATTTATAKK